MDCFPLWRFDWRMGQLCFCFPFDCHLRLRFIEPDSSTVNVHLQKRHSRKTKKPTALYSKHKQNRTRGITMHLETRIVCSPALRTLNRRKATRAVWNDIGAMAIRVCFWSGCRSVFLLLLFDLDSVKQLQGGSRWTIFQYFSFVSHWKRYET